MTLTKPQIDIILNNDLLPLMLPELRDELYASITSPEACRDLGVDRSGIPEEVLTTTPEAFHNVDIREVPLYHWVTSRDQGEIDKWVSQGRPYCETLEGFYLGVRVTQG